MSTTTSQKKNVFGLSEPTIILACTTDLCGFPENIAVIFKNLRNNEVSGDSCHGQKLQLQKVSKPFKDTGHYW